MNNLQLTLLLCVFAGMFLELLKNINGWIMAIACILVGIIIGYFASNKKIVKEEEK